MDIPALGEENLAKRMIENEKKWKMCLDRVVWREKVKFFLKKCLTHLKIWF